MPSFPLRLSSGGRYLEDQNGEPYFIHCDTAWSLIVELSLANAKTYLDDRRDKGFNSIIVNLIDHKFSSHSPAWRNANGDLPFDGSNNFDNRTQAYFDHAKDVITEAAKRNILVLLNPCYAGYAGTDEGWYDDMVSNGATKLRAYGQYVGAQFAGHNNIVWIDCGDRNPADMALVREVALGIADNDSKLHSAHAAPESSAMDVFGAESWLDFNTTYTYVRTAPNQLYTKTLVDYNRDPAMPFMMFESRYEGEGSNPDDGTPLRVRRQAWWAMTTGACGHGFGNNPIWKFASGWNGGSGIQSTGSQHMQHVWALLASRAWHRLVPDQNNTFLTGGQGTNGQENYCTAAVTGAGDFGLVYVPFSTTISVDMGKMAKKYPVTVRWMDPTDGAFTVVSGSPFGAGGVRNFSHPGNNAGGGADWVLVVEAPAPAARTAAAGGKFWRL